MVTGLDIEVGDLIKKLFVIYICLYSYCCKQKTINTCESRQVCVDVLCQIVVEDGDISMIILFQFDEDEYKFENTNCYDNNSVRFSLGISILVLDGYLLHSKIH